MSGDVRGFFAELGVPLPERPGPNVPIRCLVPEHEDRHPSCWVSVEHGAWNCKSCEAKGGPYDAAIVFGRTHLEAVALLERHGLPYGRRGALRGGAQGGHGGRTRSPVSSTSSGPAFAITEAEVERWHRALVSDSEKLWWLLTLRGWSHEAMVILGIGWDEQSGRVTIPARDAEGRLVGLGRYLPGAANRAGPVKMKQTPGSQRQLVPAPEVVDEGDGFLLFVEGEADAALGMSLGLPAVGLPGVESWKAEWAERFRGRRVVICFDCDQAGGRAAERVGDSLAGVAAEVRVLDFDPERDDGYDLTDFVLGELGDDRSNEAFARVRARLLELADAAPVVDSPSPPAPVLDVHEGAAVEDAASLLSTVEAFYRRFLVTGDDAFVALALWTAHAHALDAATFTPYIHVTSVERESGKTRVLEVAELLVPRPQETDNISVAALFRLVAAERVTLLMDEVDAVFGTKDVEKAELRSVLNAGYRRGKYAIRCGGANRTTIERHEVFGAKMLAGLHELPDTLASRCIRVEMRRQTAERRGEDLRHRHHDEAAPIREAVALWAERAVPALTEMEPEVPEAILARGGGRYADVWEPLLAIADLAGTEWGRRAREAMLTLAGEGGGDDASLGVRLLASIREVRHRIGGNAIATADLIRELGHEEEAPWGEWWWDDNTGSPVRGAQRRLAEKLKRYGVKSKSVRIADKTPKGYEWNSFEDAFSRYLPPYPQHPQHPLNHAGSGPTPIRNTDGSVADIERLADPHQQTVVADVADRNGNTPTNEGVEPGEEGFVASIRAKKDAGLLDRDQYLEQLTAHGLVLRSGELPGPRLDDVLEDEITKLVADGVLVELEEPEDDDIPF